MKTQLISLAVVFAALSFPPQSFADSAPPAAMKKSKCSNCHSVDKKKVGPSYKETAAKYKGQADAEAKLVTHLTTSPKVMVDGKEESHTSLKTPDEAKAVAQWILSQ
jgi:cytochrome c